MKKETIKTASTASTAAKNPANMTIVELIELKKSAKGLMVPIIEALISEKTKSEELQSKIKTSAKREPKAPDSYDILQPVFVALRGNVGKGITADENIIAIFQYAVHALKITLDNNIQRRLFEKTVLHNSCSNIAKADSIKSAEGRKAAFEEMLHQAMVMLPKVTEAEWLAYKKEYNTAYDKAVLKLKK